MYSKGYTRGGRVMNVKLRVCEVRRGRRAKRVESEEKLERGGYAVR